MRTQRGQVAFARVVASSREYVEVPDARLLSLNGRLKVRSICGPDMRERIGRRVPKIPAGGGFATSQSITCCSNVSVTPAQSCRRQREITTGIVALFERDREREKRPPDTRSGFRQTHVT
jgi:hypothetical protein